MITNKLAQEILTSVKAFREAAGFLSQSDELHQQLYASESIELLTAKTWEEGADALADMAVVMAGHQLDGKPFYDFENAIAGLNYMSLACSVNLIEAFRIVMISNMTKVCAAEDKNATTQKYLNEGVHIHWVQRGNLWACYSANDMPDKPKGKLLKPVTYKEPDWSRDSWKC